MDEQELRGGLRGLTVAQPELSPVLAERSVRAYRVNRRRHRAFAAAGVAAAVVAAVPAVAVLRAPAARTPAASVATWPDARDPQWVATGDKALAEFERRRADDIPPGATVRWLYAGLVPGTEETVAAAWAYCAGHTCPKIVLADGFRQQVADATDEDVWSFDVADLPSTGRAVPVSTFLSGPRGDRGPTTVVFALAPPKVRRLAWDSPSRRAGTGGAGVLTRQGGAFVGDIGYVSGPVHLRLDGGRPVPVPYGTPDNINERVGNVPLPDAVRLPATYGGGSYGTMQLRDGSLFQDRTGYGGPRLSVWARCIGSAPVVVTYRGKHYPFACDGAVHHVVVDQPAGKVTDVEFRSTDPYTGLAFAIGRR